MPEIKVVAAIQRVRQHLNINLPQSVKDLFGSGELEIQ